MEFPRLNDNSRFPNVGNVDAYKYDTPFDYSKMDRATMHIRVMSVPWDMGEVHVGNRTISGIGNIVKFDTNADRDAWIDAQECYQWDTYYRDFHFDLQIRCPLPFDVAARYNYVVVDYDNLPVEYEESGGVKRWLYFIREVERESNNSTILHVKRDTWQTYINDVDISYVWLAQGHAPMASVDVGTYLNDPIDNSDYLLTQDVNYGEDSLIPYSKATVLDDGTMYACIVMSGNPTVSWGSKSGDDWRTFASVRNVTQGVISDWVIACPVSDIGDLIDDVNSQIPQMMQTIRGIFLVSDKLITIGSSFTLCGHTCYRVSATQRTHALLSLDKTQFGYDQRYEDIAKLYTWPYAHIEICDESGNVSEVRVEDTTGTLDLQASLSLVYPWIHVSGSVMGIGSHSRQTLTFKTMNSLSYRYGGRWYDHQWTWDIPLVEVRQSPATYNDYSTHYDRAQQAIAYGNEYDSSIASANAAKTTADNSADGLVENTTTQTTANTSVTNRGNVSSTNDTTYTNGLNQALQAWNAGYTRATTSSKAEADYASAGIGAGTSAVSGLVSGAISGGPVGALAGIASGAIAGVGNIAQTAVSVGLMQTQAEQSIENSQNQVTATNNNALDRLANSTQSNSAITTLQNNAARAIAANQAAIAKENSTTQRTAAYGNASRSRNTAQNAISNQIAQARLDDVQHFGEYRGSSTVSVKPQALFANIVTQSRNAIRQAGDHMLRYGYALNQWWEFKGFNVMPKFSYWQCDEVIVKGLNVPDLYMDEIRFFLLGGVTIWRRPEDIGNVSIYDN